MSKRYNAGGGIRLTKFELYAFLTKISTNICELKHRISSVILYSKLVLITGHEGRQSTQLNRIPTYK